MSRRSASVIAVYAAAMSIAGCGGAGTPVIRAEGGTLQIQTASQPLMLNSLDTFPPPVPVTVTSSSGFGAGGISVTSTQPSLVGAWVSSLTPGSTSATVSVLAIGGTQAPVTVNLTDSLGDHGSFTVSAGLCGRPDQLDYAQLMYPPNNSTGVSLSTPTIYVAGSEPAGLATPGPVPPPGKLHFVLNDSSTLEGTTLSYAAPPPGSSTPAPLGNAVTFYGAEPMPALKPATKYDVYLYDDACEAPFLAGTFST